MPDNAAALAAARAAFLEQCFPPGLASREARIRDAERGLRAHRTLDRLVLSVLSDAQELADRHDSARCRDLSRRFINYAKWLLDERAAFEWLDIGFAPSRDGARGRKFLLWAPDWPEVQVAERTGDGLRDWLINNSPAYEWGKHGPATVFRPLLEPPRRRFG